MRKISKYAAKLLAAALALLSVLCLLPADAFAVSQSDIDELNEEIARLDEEKDEYAQRIEGLADDMSTVLERKQILDAQITATMEQIVATETLINAYEEEMLQLEKDIAAAQRELDEARLVAGNTYELYCERVRAMEEAGLVTYWGIVFESEDFSDMLSRLDFIIEVLSYNEQVINNYNAVCETIASRQAELESHLAEKQEIINANELARAELLARNEELNVQRAQANELILEINADQENYRDVIAQLEAEEEAIHAEIAALEAQLEYQRRVAAARAAAEAARKRAEEEARKKAEEEAAKNQEQNGGANTGGSTGGNTGGAVITPGTPESGSGNEGGSTGGNTGGATITPSTPESGGGNEGGSTGGNSGGATITPGTPESGGNESGGSSGDSSGSGSSGSTGGAIIVPSTPSTPEIDDSYLDAYRGYIWPVPSRTINSYFGYRSPEETGGVGSTYHRGIDIGRVYYSTTVVASKGGYVAISTYSDSYGNYVVIDHGDGSKTLYAHMSSRSVSAGQTVYQGQAIGVTGSTGNSTGPHLHFEIMINGSNVDPLGYLP